MSHLFGVKRSAGDYTVSAKPELVIQFPDDIENGTPTFLTEKLEEIIARGKAQKLPIFIISITGVLRSGKSFLLNLMKTYLNHYSHHKSDVGWETSDLKVEDGRWAKSKDSVTHGIWVWNHPFIINGVAVLLMDCQGTGDSKMSSPTLDNLILYMGLQLANVQILNLKSVLQTSDMERLDLCADYAEADSDGKALFDSLIFLIRDWEADDYYGEKKDDFNQMIKEAKAPSVKKFGAAIKKSFRSINTYAMPHPGLTVIKCSDQDQKLRVSTDYIDEEYLMVAKDLFNKLFVKMPDPRALLTGKYINRKFRALRDRTVDTEIGKIKIQSAAEAFEESLLNQAFIEATQFFDDLMTKAFDKDFENDDQLDRHLNGIVDDTIERFTTKRTITKYQDSPSKRKYLDLLKQKRNGIKENKAFITMTRKLKEERDELERKVNQQQKDVDDLKAKHKRLQEEQMTEEAVGKQIQMQAASPQRMQQKPVEKKSIPKTKTALKNEQEKAGQDRGASEPTRQQEERVNREVLAKLEKDRLALIREKEAERDNLTSYAEGRMKQEKNVMGELREKLRQRNDEQDDLVPEEKWIEKAEEKIIKGKKLSCTIL